MGVDKSVSQTHSLAVGSFSNPANVTIAVISAANISPKKHPSTITNDNRSLPVKKYLQLVLVVVRSLKLKTLDFMEESPVNMAILEKLNSIVARQDSLEKAFS